MNKAHQSRALDDAMLLSPKPSLCRTSGKIPYSSPRPCQFDLQKALEYMHVRFNFKKCLTGYFDKNKAAMLIRLERSLRRDDRCSRESVARLEQPLLSG